MSSRLHLLAPSSSCPGLTLAPFCLLQRGKNFPPQPEGAQGPSNSITGLVGGERREQTRLLLRGEASASDSKWGGLSSSVTWPLKSGVSMYCQYHTTLSSLDYLPALLGILFTTALTMGGLLFVFFLVP